MDASSTHFGTTITANAPTCWDKSKYPVGGLLGASMITIGGLMAAETISLGVPGQVVGSALIVIGTGLGCYSYKRERQVLTRSQRQIHHSGENIGTQNTLTNSPIDHKENRQSRKIFLSNKDLENQRSPLPLTVPSAHLNMDKDPRDESPDSSVFHTISLETSQISQESKKDVCLEFVRKNWQKHARLHEYIGYDKMNLNLFFLNELVNLPQSDAQDYLKRVEESYQSYANRFSTKSHRNRVKISEETLSQLKEVNKTSDPLKVALLVEQAKEEMFQVLSKSINADWIQQYG